MTRERGVPGADEAVTVRRALPSDADALRCLATLDEAAPLRGEVIVAEIGGEIWAARSLLDGRTLGDPFRPSTWAGGLLELHARQLELVASGRGGPRRGLLGLRALLRAVAAS